LNPTKKGIKRFMKEHPEQSRPGRRNSTLDIIALGRYIIWGWPMGEAGSDLEQAGIRPDEVAYRGSNEILLAPRRTAMHVSVAIIDPHLSWYGEFRFTRCGSMRETHISGVSILGVPFRVWPTAAMFGGNDDRRTGYLRHIRRRSQSLIPAPVPVRRPMARMKIRKEFYSGEGRRQSRQEGSADRIQPSRPVVAHKEGKA